MRAAASLTFCTAGSSRPMRMAMMAITTNSSIKVKPDLFPLVRERPLAGDMAYLSYQDIERTTWNAKSASNRIRSRVHPRLFAPQGGMSRQKVKKKLGREDAEYV